MTFKVKIFLPDGEIVPGTLSYTAEGPRLSDTNNCTIDATGKSIEFSITDASTNESTVINKQDRVSFDSLTFYRKYIRDHPGQQDHYPPSTEGWIRYLSNNGLPVRIDLHEINNGDRYLLSCIDIENEEILRFHSIKSYEANLLRIEPDMGHYQRVYMVLDEDEDEVSLDKLLEAPAPSWPDLDSLTTGIDIPNLQRYETAGETLAQLIPSSFPEDVKKELMVFLAWTLRVTIPKEDPLDFLNTMIRRFSSGPRLQSLVFGHVQCLIQGTPIPQYVRIFTLAERGALAQGVRTQTEDSEHESWSKAWYRISELFPNRIDRIMKLTNQLNLNQEIHTNLPITKEDAASSKEAWLDRFSLIRSNFLLRGYIQERKIGLEKMVYIGGAHRWPHKHLQYTARLGQPDQKPPYLQVMVMPKTAVDRISRIKQNIVSIDWTASRLNLNLYSASSDSWKYNASHFLKSFNNQRTRRQLDKEFELPSSPDVIPIDEQDTKLLDLLSWNLHPHTFEIGGYDNSLHPMKNQEIQDRIGRYLKEKLIQLRYLPSTSGRVSICLEIKGPLGKLYSISRASLRHLPTSTVMLSTSEEVCFIMARVPEKDVYSILAELPAKVKDYEISMKGYRVSAYAGYVHNFYQRLRTPNGTWDDDVSGLLSQITK